MLIMQDETFNMLSKLLNIRYGESNVTFGRSREMQQLKQM